MKGDLPVTDPITMFDGSSISYTYDNGWSFTNHFEGNLRISHVPRGELREEVKIEQLREGLFFLSWVDDEMGLLGQIIDLETKTVLASIPSEDGLTTQTIRVRRSRLNATVKTSPAG